MKSYKFIFRKMDRSNKEILAENIFFTSGGTFAAARAKLNTAFGFNVLVKMQQDGFQNLAIREI